MEKFLMYIILALLTFIGFFWYWGRTSGSLKEGGVVYEWWKNYRQKKKNEKKSKNTKQK
ncbi:MAG: hypothetical protein IKL55_01095 [Clostridia bacterium]|nr:hypothetical protein [Clostridia bacterium]